MSGLKNQFVESLGITLQLVDPTTGLAAGPTATNGVSQILYAFMRVLQAQAATYSTTKTLDSNFIVSSKKIVVAIPNVTFFNQQYPESEHFLIAAFRILTGANASTDATVWLPGISDAALMAGTFNAVNNGTIEMKDVPFDNFPLSTNVADQDTGWLPNLKGILWKAQTNFQINAIWPTATATANLNMNIQAHGMKLI